MTKPIPKCLLIHSAVLYEVSEGKWQDEKRTVTAELSHIRIEPCTKLVSDKDNRSVEISAVLFYDCCNSRPKAVEFAEGQRVEFGGKLYRVQSIERISDDRRLHHLEVGLCQ